jgi:SPP1 gp7 family putative phage head morphogenesis protein
MRNAEYWKKRFEQLQISQLNKGDEYVKTLEQQYRVAISEIEKTIQSWYERIAVNNKISLAGAKKLLTANELKEFKWTVEEYIKYGEENAINQNWIKQLENASAKVHITKYEAQITTIRQEIEKLYAEQEKGTKALIKNIYEDNYYHTAYEVQKGIGSGRFIEVIDDKSIEKAALKPWAPDGSNFSSRVWRNKTLLLNTLHTELTQSYIRGASPDKVINNIKDKLDVGKKQAARLVMTESAAVAAMSRKDCYTDLNVERFQFIGTLDMTTCEHCGAMDGKIFEQKDYEIGVSAEPLHPWCRCTTAPYFEDDEGQRVARDKDGKEIYIPSNMSYREWKDKFVDKKELTNSGKDDIILSKSKTIETPIQQRNTAKGKPNAILLFDRPLNNRQQKLLDNLQNYDSKTIVKKNEVKMSDLSALTAKTGNEFAMFTKGNKRLIIRGNEYHVNVNEELAMELKRQGYKWSGHTHPGVTGFELLESDGDIKILNVFNQNNSSIYNSSGKHIVFQKKGG